MKIYHNPRCSKSRQALALIHDAGHDVEIIEYLKNPPSPEDLAAVIGKLTITAEQLVRKKESLYKELGLDQQSLSEEQWVNILCENPKLIERPIVIKDDQAVIGRPPELIQPLL